MQKRIKKIKNLVKYSIIREGKNNMTEWDKMVSGQIYNANHPELIKKRHIAHKLCQKYNRIDDKKAKKREKIINQLLPNHKDGLYLQGPIYFDYGISTTFGKNCYANFNLTVLDVCPVTIGDNVFFGPNVSLLTPLHPLCYEDRNPYFDKELGYVTDKEYAAPISIGDNCWIAGGVTICGGVTIGSETVIGAGSVVTKDIPSHVLAFGVPCKVKRAITEQDLLKNKKN